MHRLPPSEDRADLSSATPLGFAYAVFAANSARLIGRKHVLSVEDSSPF